MGNIFDCGRIDEKILQKLDDLNSEIQIVKSKLSKFEWDKNYHEINPWFEMSITDRSRVRNLRSKLFNVLNLSDNTACCWVTGKIGDVKVAHIIPDSARKIVLNRLGLTSDFKNNLDTNHPLNLMLLDSSIEEAFDNLQLSFVPRDILNPCLFLLKIWDDSLRNNPEISKYENHPLKVPDGVVLSRRALSFQTFIAYINSKRQNPSNACIDEPADFASEYDGKDEYRKYLASLLHTSIREEMHIMDNDRESTKS